MITEVINSREDIKVDEEIRVAYNCILKIAYFVLKYFLFLILCFIGRWVRFVMEQYDQALQNWLYIKKNLDSIDLQVLLQIGRWHEQLDSAE